MNAHIIAWRFNQILRNTVGANNAIDQIGKDGYQAAAKHAIEQLAKEVEFAKIF